METKEEASIVPVNFHSVIKDFVTDLTITFPEYSYLWAKWSDPSISDYDIEQLYGYSMTVYPERFFDILYQTDSIFDDDCETNVYFLPNVNFKLLFRCDGISENTKKTMWKYLQLMLFTVVGGVNDKTKFGEAINMFDGIDETELQEKLAETIAGMTDFFKTTENENADSENKNNDASTDEEQTAPNPNMEGFKNMFENMPNAENLQDHLKTLFDGKIGKLAKEMAEEISGDFVDILGGDTGDIKNTQDVLKKLMKNPKKIMDLMKTVGSKLDNKMKSGEISKEEIMKEAGDLMGRMKEMGGQDQFTEMFKNMAKSMGGAGKNMRMDTNAIDRMTKQASTRERMLKKMEQNKQAKMASAANFSLQQTNKPNDFVFRLDGESSQQKSSIQSPADAMAELLLKEELEQPAIAAKTSSTKKKKSKKGGK